MVVDGGVLVIDADGVLGRRAIRVVGLVVWRGGVVVQLLQLVGSHIKHLLDCISEAEEVVVDQTCWRRLVTWLKVWAIITQYCQGWYACRGHAHYEFCLLIYLHKDGPIHTMLPMSL